MIHIKNLNKSYYIDKEQSFEVLKGINLDITAGEMVAIMGESGAGKSTLMHVIACIDKYDNGEFILDGKSIERISDREMAAIRGEKIGIVMQDFALIEDFTAFQNIAIPMDFSKKKYNKAEKKDIIHKLLEDVSMGDYVYKKVSKMSGGQRQRVAIARALANEPKIILADEPTGALDSRTSKEIMTLLKEINKKGTTMIIITHDINVAKVCDRIITIEDGRIKDAKI